MNINNHPPVRQFGVNGGFNSYLIITGAYILSVHLRRILAPTSANVALPSSALINLEFPGCWVDFVYEMGKNTHAFCQRTDKIIKCTNNELQFPLLL